MLLEVYSLSKLFGGVRAVDDVTWAIDAGQTRCIIGPNGAGKSTFFQLLIGRLKANKGSIKFQAVDITRLHPFERARLGLAVKPQTLGVFSELTVEHNLRVCLQRIARGQILENLLLDHLSRLGLLAKSKFLTKELSYGEKQWLGIGMAVATAPKLLLLDEPTAGMSAAETDKTIELIKGVAATGTSVVVVEHDMAFVRSLAVEITVFHNGRIFATGSLEKIENNEDVQRLYLGKRGAARLRQ